MKKPPAQARQTTHAVGQTARPAKPVAPRGSATGGKGTATHKHGSVHAKHHPRKARKWTPDGDVALCSARAVAEALRLAMGPVLSDADVLALYWSTAGDTDEGQSVLDALSAAHSHYPIGFGEVMPRELLPSGRSGRSGGSRLRVNGAGLVLGLDLPGAQPHSVAVGPDGTWWSWGEPFSPGDWPGLAVEECWAVTWQ